MAHNDKIDESLFKEIIIERNIAEFAEENQKICGANKNLYRYFPSGIDGLKPVERRFLYALYIHKIYKVKVVKLEKAKGNVTSFHPHGTDSVVDVAVALSQPWNQNVTLVRIDGNKGSIRGTKHAAARYLDVCMSDFAYDCYFDDFQNVAVDMQLNYLGDEYEPEFLPAKYPIALINGGFSSIGYGQASNIPLYNFKEVCETLIKLIDNPDAKCILYPDIPTGVDIIMKKSEAKDLWNKAENNVKIVMRAHADIDYINNIITITSIPIQTNTMAIVQAITELIMTKKFEGTGSKGEKINEIIDVQDLTTKQGKKNADAVDVNIKIILHKDANPEKVLEKLYKMKTNLKKSNASVNTMINDYTSRTYSIKEFLLWWINYRRDIVRSSFNNKYQKLIEEVHLNDVKLFVYNKDNGEKTIKTAKSSETTEEYKDKLMKIFGISSLQAEVIANLGSKGYTKEYYEKFKETKVKLEEEISNIEKILESPTGIDDEIKRQLKEGIEKYGTPRASRIIGDEDETVDSRNVIIGITSDGFIKKVVQDDTGSIGPVSKDSQAMLSAFVCNNTDAIIVFDSDGYKHLIQVSALPIFTKTNFGLSLSKYCKIGKSKPVSSGIINRQIIDTLQYLVITKNGFAKIIDAKELIKRNGEELTSSSFIKLNQYDEVVITRALPNNSDCSVIVYTDYADGIRVAIDDIPHQTIQSKGSKIISLAGNEQVFGANLILTDNDKYLIYVTSNGKVKKTETQFFPITKKKESPLCLVNLDEDEYLVSVKAGNDNEYVTFFKKKGDKETLSIKDIPLKTRAARAEKMIKLKKGDVVLSMIITD